MIENIYWGARIEQKDGRYYIAGFKGSYATLGEAMKAVDKFQENVIKKRNEKRS